MKFDYQLKVEDRFGLLLHEVHIILIFRGRASNSCGRIAWFISYGALIHTKLCSSHIFKIYYFTMARAQDNCQSFGLKFFCLRKNVNVSLLYYLST